ncbi:hypothetical protein MKW11_13080 [Gluconobacter frateurii]|uniref:hypothetical protein n=1 Tax=Gluconobacter frateurii TaxID=38308 RepID=UPI001F05EEDD|nr:hypothetical protein [Gluconobacter frateurii]UMM08109.1 hypothetical protein MKW11_13080 [Gluconobacter frateurii]
MSGEKTVRHLSSRMTPYGKSLSLSNMISMRLRLDETARKAANLAYSHDEIEQN